MALFSQQRKLEKQQEDIQELMQLSQANPDLPILPMVDSDVVCDDTYSWWLGGFGGCRIDEVVAKGDAIVFKSDKSYDDLYEEFFIDDADWNPDATDEEVKAKVDSLPWMKCITVTIGLPEFIISHKNSKR